MKSLKIDYLSLPAQTSGFMTHTIRQRWLELEKKDFQLINEIYSFNYLLTERSHKLDLEIVYDNESWILYKLN